MTRRYERLTGSLSVLARLDELDNPDQALADLHRNIVEAVAFGLGAENCSLMLFDDARAALELKAVYSPLEATPRSFEEGDWSNRAFQFGEGVVGRVAEMGDAVRIEDTLDDPRFVRDDANRMPIRSLMCFPIRIRDEIAGAINLSHTKPNVFSIESEHMMTLIAGRVSRLLTNHRLHWQLRDSEAHYRLLTEYAGDAIVVFDPGGAILSANPAVEQLIGESPDALLRSDARWEARVHADDRTRFSAHCRLALERDEPLTIEYRLLDTEDREHEVEQHSSRLMDAAGRVTGVVTIMRDMTRRKRDEAEQRAFEAQLHHTQKLESLGILASGAAHDFNNLLVAVLGNIELTLQSLAEESPERKRLVHVQTAAKRAADLSKQLLAYAGKGNVSKQLVQLSAVVEEMKPLIASIAKRVALDYTLAPSLSEVEGDLTQIRQILMNLVTNATEAVGEKGGCITVRTGSVVDAAVLRDDPYVIGDCGPGSYVFLEVSDNGCGMDAATRNRIFDPFFTTKPKGRGVGLASVFGIIRGHGGVVRVVGEPGAGSTFTVFLPVAGEPARRPKGEAVSDEAWRGSGTVLVVDDDATVRALATQMLKLIGFDVISAEDGAKAVQLYRERRDEIRAVLLDSSMPGLDGGEVLAALRVIDPSVAVLCTSGSGDHGVLKDVTERDAVPFLPKPYELTDLRDKMHELLA